MSIPPVETGHGAAAGPMSGLGPPPGASAGMGPGLVPAHAGAPSPGRESAGDDVSSQEAALIEASPGLARGGQLGLTPAMARMPVELGVAIPVPDFRVRNLLALERGQLVETGWGSTEDVPLASGAVQLAWTEFEVVESRLGVRITRLG